MSKKKLLLVEAMMMIACALMCNVCVAAKYPKYLLGDTDYILCTGRMGIGYYVDTTTIEIISTDPLKISANKVLATYADEPHKASYDDSEIISVRYGHTNVYYYDLEERKIYIRDCDNENTERKEYLERYNLPIIELDDGIYRYIGPDRCWAEAGVSYPAANKIYEYLYGESFNGK